MPHMIKIYRLPDRNEYEIGYRGLYGRKGEKRGRRKKMSPEQMKRQNQINRENRTRRLIIANFIPGDYFATLKYPAGTRKPMEEVRTDFRNFINRLKRIYSKYNTPLKYIYRIEIGSQGGIHIHMIVNRIKGADTDMIIQDKWGHGRVNFQSIYKQGGYKALAEYITKRPDVINEPDQFDMQGMLFDEGSGPEVKDTIAVHSSRNLVRPEPEVKVYKKSVRKLVMEGPKAKEGYYIDRDSIVMGINPYTGMSYIHYTEILLRPEKERRIRNNVFEGFGVQTYG